MMTRGSTLGNAGGQAPDDGHATFGVSLVPVVCPFQQLGKPTWIEIVPVEQFGGAFSLPVELSLQP
jgi:hypothetical protein